MTWSFNVFFDLRLNKRLSKQSWGWWSETPSRSLSRHCCDINLSHLTGFYRLFWKWIPICEMSLYIKYGRRNMKTYTCNYIVRIDSAAGVRISIWWPNPIQIWHCCWFFTFSERLKNVKKQQEGKIWIGLSDDQDIARDWCCLDNSVIKTISSKHFEWARPTGYTAKTRHMALIEMNLWIIFYNYCNIW